MKSAMSAREIFLLRVAPLRTRPMLGSCPPSYNLRKYRGGSKMGRQRVEPGPGQESVWDYPRPPRLEDSDKRIKVVFGGVTLVYTRRAKRVLETSHPPVYY